MVAGKGLEPSTFGLLARRATNCLTEKLELSAKMPALVELRKGAVAKVTTVASEADVQKALA